MPDVLYKVDLPAFTGRKECTNKGDCKCNREGRIVCKAGITTRNTQIRFSNKSR